MDNLKRKVIAIHQPNYLPWPGFFYKMYRCDTFVFLDHVKLNKRGYTRRTNIADAEHVSGKILLTIPLLKHSDYSKINELSIDHSKNWAHNHLQRIYRYYLHFPHFKEAYPLIENLFQHSTRFSKLSEWNIYLIEEISAYIGILRQCLNSSVLDPQRQKNEMNAEIVKLMGGTHYLCGEGAKDSYFNKNEFEDLNIQCLYSNLLGYLEQHPYRPDPIACKTSMLDMLFWLGAEGVKQYFSRIN